MASEYLSLAKAHLDFVQAERIRIGGQPSCSKLMDEARLAVQIAQVEATERLSAALAGVPLLAEPLPFEDGSCEVVVNGGECVHGIAFDDPCIPCMSLYGRHNRPGDSQMRQPDADGCLHGRQDGACEAWSYIEVTTATGGCCTPRQSRRMVPYDGVSIKETRKCRGCRKTGVP